MRVRIYLFLLFAAIASAQAPTKGTIAGGLFDGATGQPVRGAKVEVNGQSDQGMVTDTDGKYRIELSPGQYKLRFTADNYSETTIEAVNVVAGEVTEASTVMSNKSTVTTLEVVEKVGAVAATAEAMLMERKLSATVSDSISSDDIRKSVASDAAGAIEKVTGVSVVDSGYVYVRGLGERYSATMLNNAMIPTTEPERRVVPLDLFPAALIDSIKVQKTYSPDLPGEFSGGLVQMQTVEFPTAKVFRVSGSVGFNTKTTFNRFNGYRGGGRDFLGFDDGTRSLPSSIPEDGRLFSGPYTPQQLQQFGQAFAVNYELDPVESMRPQQSYSVVAGNTFGNWGLVGALTFNNAPQRYDETQRYLVNSGGGVPLIYTNYEDFQAHQEAAKLGGVFNAAYRINPTNKLVFRNTLTHDTDKEGRIFTGVNGGTDSIIQNTRLRWVERNLFASGVEGEHAVARLGNSVFRWQMTYSQTARNEPDLRETIRSPQPDGTFAFVALPQSGTRFFNNLSDRIYEPLVEWTKPFYRGSVTGVFKAGFRGTFRDRDFAARRFRFVPIRSSTLDFNQPTDILLGLPNIRPDGFEIRENTRGTDTYVANMDVYAGYSMVDLAIGPRWRVVGGVRVEDANISVVTVDPLIPGAVPVEALLKNTDPLPAVNVIYALTPRMNLRGGYGRTLSRPDFRELSPFDFTNVLGGFNTTGNPNLKRASIQNYDFRWEWFPGGDQVVAASYFFKDFTDPIEVTIQPTTDLRQSYVNAAGARNQGIELEARKTLGSIHPTLRQLAVQTNFTMVSSEVRLSPDQAQLLTSKSRPLVGQSKFIFNVITEWTRPQWRSSARFYANSISRRITDVGTFQLPDIYQEGNLFLDFVYQYDIQENGRWSLRFSAENMADNHYHWTQADILQRSYRMGRTFTVGTSFSIF